MLVTILGSVAAALVNTLLRMFFPGHPQITPEVVAQAQKDRADTLASQIKARKDADALREEISTKLAKGAIAGGSAGVPDGDRLHQHDANERD